MEFKGKDEDYLVPVTPDMLKDWVGPVWEADTSGKWDFYASAPWMNMSTGELGAFMDTRRPECFDRLARWLAGDLTYGSVTVGSKYSKHYSSLLLLLRSSNGTQAWMCPGVDRDADVHAALASACRSKLVR